MTTSCGSGGQHDAERRVSARLWSRPWARAFVAAASLPVGCWRVIAADSTVGGGAGVHHTGRPTGEPTVSGTVGVPGGAAEAWAGPGGRGAVLVCGRGLAAVPTGRWP